MDDPEDQNDPNFVECVEHDTIVTDAESMKRVTRPVNRLDRLAADPAWLRHVAGEPFESVTDPLSDIRRETLERLDGRRRQLDAVRCQVRFSRLVVRPSA